MFDLDPRDLDDERPVSHLSHGERSRSEGDTRPTLGRDPSSADREQERASRDQVIDLRARDHDGREQHRDGPSRDVFERHVDLPRGRWREIEPATGPTHGTSEESLKGPRRLPLIHPVGIDRGGATVFVCLITEASPDRFRRALQGLLAHLATVHPWSLFVVFTAPVARLTRTCQTMVREELESPLTDEDVQGLWKLFLRRREGTHERRDLPTPPGVAAVGAGLFAHLRFSALYRHWMDVRDAAFTPLKSTAAVDAMAEGRGRVTYRTLAQQYDHLVPVADQGAADLTVAGATEEGTTHAHRLNPGSQPRAHLHRSAAHPGLRGGRRPRRAVQVQECQADTTLAQLSLFAEPQRRRSSP
jgi:hypothetical protein